MKPEARWKQEVCRAKNTVGRTISLLGSGLGDGKTCFAEGVVASKLDLGAHEFHVIVYMSGNIV